MITFVFPEDIYELRHKELRSNLPIESTHFESDFAIGSFHLGYIQNKKIISIVSLCLNFESINQQQGYQLRGMATESNNKGKGFGTKLCLQAFKILSALEQDFLWCNARESAEGFYLKLGFEPKGDYFDIPTAGKHIRMIKKLY